MKDTIEGDESAAEQPPSYSGACVDCGRRYGDAFGFPDLVVDDAAWREIMPDAERGDVLCPSCMCRRAHDAGVTCFARFTSGPFAVPG